MTTRQEIRRQQQPEAIPHNNHPRHRMRVFWGIVALTLLGVSLLFSQTVLNQHFAEHEIQRSDLASTVNNNLNDVAGKYGITGGVLDDSTTNKLLKQAVDQIYSGQQLNLDFSSAIKKSTSGTGTSIDGIQPPQGLLSSSIGSAATNGVSAALNQQINSPELQKFTGILKTWQTVNTIVMVVSAIVLVVTLVIMIIGRATMGSFIRLVGIAAVLLLLVTEAVKAIVVAIGRQFPDYSSLLIQVANDIAQVGFHYCLALAILLLVLICLRIGFTVVRRRIKA